MSPRELIDQMLRKSPYGTLADIEASRWVDCQPPFRQAHYLDGFPWPDGKFRFKPDWDNVPFRSAYKSGPIADMPPLPDYWTVVEEADAAHPFRLATSPARGFLNSTFNETPTSLANEKRPEVMIHPDDAQAQGIADGDFVVLGNTRGQVRLHARLYRRRPSGRADCGIDLAECGLCRRLRHQFADRCGSDCALWRRGLPRQQGLDPAGVTRKARAAARASLGAAVCPRALSAAWRRPNTVRRRG